MKISNAYLTIPVTLQWQATNKIEVSAGVYASYLIGPRGNGTIYFEKTRIVFSSNSHWYTITQRMKQVA